MTLVGIRSIQPRQERSPHSRADHDAAVRVRIVVLCYFPGMPWMGKILRDYGGGPSAETRQQRGAQVAGDRTVGTTGDHDVAIRFLVGLMSLLFCRNVWDACSS